MSYSRMPAVYIAGPYRSATRDGVELHIQAARHVGLLACRKGWAPIIPHSNTAHMDLYAPDLGDGFWLASTMEAMRRCDAVCLVPGWERSAGTMAEIEEAKRLGIPVFSPDTLPAAGHFVAGRETEVGALRPPIERPATMPPYVQPLGRICVPAEGPQS
jgi:hypothetical protein